jgi:hypothetical protein
MFLLSSSDTNVTNLPFSLRRRSAFNFLKEKIRILIEYLFLEVFDVKTIQVIFVGHGGC